MTLASFVLWIAITCLLIFVTSMLISVILGGGV